MLNQRYIKQSVAELGQAQVVLEFDSETDSPGWNDNKKFDLDEQAEPIWTIDILIWIRWTIWTWWFRWSRWTIWN